MGRLKVYDSWAQHPDKLLALKLKIARQQLDEAVAMRNAFQSQNWKRVVEEIEAETARRLQL